jgi:hypothetical protein
VSQGPTKGIPIDTDGTLVLNSDLLVPSEKAIRTYLTNNYLPLSAQLPKPPLRLTIGDGITAIVAAATPVAYIYMPYAGTISKWTALADVSGSISVDVWKDVYANHPPVVGDKISASAPIAITTATSAQDSTLSGWTKTVNAGDIIAFYVSSSSTIKACYICIEFT